MKSWPKNSNENQDLAPLTPTCSNFHPSQPRILTALPETFLSEMKPSKWPVKVNTNGTRLKREKRGKKREWNLKVKTTVSPINPKTIRKFCFLCMAELLKLILGIWNRRLQIVSAQPTWQYKWTFGHFRLFVPVSDK